MSRGDFTTPPPKEYAGPSGIARDSVWLTQEDLPHDRDVEVTIEKVHRRNNVKFEGGRAKDVVISLVFKGIKRELGLNATNRKTLNALFGTKCADWAGKRIAIFVAQGISSPMGVVPAVRIRPKHIAQEQAVTAPQPDATDAAESAAIRDEAEGGAS